MAKSLPSIENPEPTDFIGPPEPAAVATLEKPSKARPATKPASNIVSQMAQQQASMLEAGEELCRRMAAGESIDETERLIFSALQWNEMKIKQEVARLRSVLDWQAKAGSNQELEHAKAFRDQQQETLPSEIEKLRQQIEKLQLEMNDKQSALQRAGQRVEEMESARIKLRSMTPEHITAAYHRQRSAINRSELATKSRESESRANMIRNLLENYERPADFQSENAVVNHCETAAPHLIIRTESVRTNRGNTMVSKTVSPGAWQSYCDSLRQELPKLEQFVSESKAQLAAEVAKLEAATLDIYIS